MSTKLTSSDRRAEHGRGDRDRPPPASRRGARAAERDPQREFAAPSRDDPRTTHHV